MYITKDEFRKKCLQKAKKVGINRYYHNAMVNKKLQKLLVHVNKKTKILIYMPLPNEADIRKTIQKFRKKSQLFLPFMVEKSFKMVPYRLPLKKKRFGIFEAGKSLKNIKNIDIAIVPIVGYDKNFQRIGFGKGMYDRFFEKLPKKPYTVFVQLRGCKALQSLCDSYDIEADLLITSELWLEKRR